MVGLAVLNKLRGATGNEKAVFLSLAECLENEVVQDNSHQGFD